MQSEILRTLLFRGERMHFTGGSLSSRAVAAARYAREDARYLRHEKALDIEEGDISTQGK